MGIIEDLKAEAEKNARNLGTSVLNSVVTEIKNIGVNAGLGAGDKTPNEVKPVPTFESAAPQNQGNSIMKYGIILAVVIGAVLLLKKNSGRV